MDTVKQALAGIVGSVVLAGCLGSQGVFDSPEVANTDETEDGDTTAWVWPAPLELDAGASPDFNGRTEKGVRIIFARAPFGPFRQHRPDPSSPARVGPPFQAV